MPLSEKIQTILRLRIRKTPSRKIEPQLQITRVTESPISDPSVTLPYVRHPLPVPEVQETAPLNNDRLLKKFEK